MMLHMYGLEGCENGPDRGGIDHVCGEMRYVSIAFVPGPECSHQVGFLKSATREGSKELS